MITCILPCLGYPQKNFECPQFNPFKYYLPMPMVSGKKNQNWSVGTLFGGPPKFSPSKIMTLVSICLEKYREPLLQVS